MLGGRRDSVRRNLGVNLAGGRTKLPAAPLRQDFPCWGCVWPPRPVSRPAALRASPGSGAPSWCRRLLFGRRYFRPLSERAENQIAGAWTYLKVFHACKSCIIVFKWENIFFCFIEVIIVAKDYSWNDFCSTHPSICIPSNCQSELRITWGSAGYYYYYYWPDLLFKMSRFSAPRRPLSNKKLHQ